MCLAAQGIKTAVLSPGKLDGIRPPILCSRKLDFQVHKNAIVSKRWRCSGTKPCYSHGNVLRSMSQLNHNLVLRVRTQKIYQLRICNSRLDIKIGHGIVILRMNPRPWGSYGGGLVHHSGTTPVYKILYSNCLCCLIWQLDWPTANFIRLVTMGGEAIDNLLDVLRTYYLNR